MEDLLTSMRPAQLTPENQNIWKIGNPGLGNFNEAGAINAGKRARSPPRRRQARDFNEAGAINAGKQSDATYNKLIADLTSMRPAQLTPENMPLLIKNPRKEAKLQ